MLIADFWLWKYAMFAVEAALVVFLLAFSCRFPAVERRFREIARRQWAPLGVGVLAMALRLALLSWQPIPVPLIHDEFSYLLQADTFAHGRLANPPHPMWEHFETFHVDQFPTYASMYPPLPGLMLASGQVATGVPFLGVVLSIGLMCGTLCWALRGWFPPAWALLGSLIAVVRIALFSYWGNSYWGGAIAATGGALLIGALPRLIRHSRPRDAVLAAVGIGVLANSRPYEGAVLAAAVGLVALWQFKKLRMRVILPAAGIVLVAVAALTAYYNWRVFGSPTTLPYIVNRNTYAVAPVFLFQSLRPEPVYRHEVMRQFYTGWERGVYERGRTLRGYFYLSLDKLISAWSFFVGPALTMPLLAGLVNWRSRRTRIFLFLAGMVLASCIPTTFFNSHYVAGATVVFYGLFLRGLRVLALSVPRMARAVPPICAAMAALAAALGATGTPVNTQWPATWARVSGTPMERDSVISQLSAEPGRHLVLVRYRGYRDSFAEYVFNGADIDASNVVWARDMGPAKNQELLQYYSDRKAWLFDDNSDPHLALYKATP